jgi:hypothetical protein
VRDRVAVQRAVAERQHPVGAGEPGRLRGGQQHRDVLVLRDHLQRRQQVLAFEQVDAARRLVDQQQLRLLQQRPRQHDADQLALRQLARAHLGARAGADAVEHRLRARACAIDPRPHGEQRHGDVLDDQFGVRGREARVAVRDAAAQRALRLLGDVHAAQQHAAGVGRLEPGRDPQQRRAPGEAPAPHADDLAGAQLERDVAQRLHLAATAEVGLRDAVEREQAHGTRARTVYVVPALMRLRSPERLLPSQPSRRRRLIVQRRGEPEILPVG